MTVEHAVAVAPAPMSLDICTGTELTLLAAGDGANSCGRHGIFVRARWLARKLRGDPDRGRMLPHPSRSRRTRLRFCRAEARYGTPPHMGGTTAHTLTIGPSGDTAGESGPDRGPGEPQRRAPDRE